MKYNTDAEKDEDAIQKTRKFFEKLTEIESFSIIGIEKLQ